MLTVVDSEALVLPADKDCGYDVAGSGLGISMFFEVSWERRYMNIARHASWALPWETSLRQVRRMRPIAPMIAAIMAQIDRTF